MLTKIIFGTVAAFAAGTGGYFLAAPVSTAKTADCCNGGAPCCNPPRECCFVAKTEAKAECCVPGSGCCAATEACCVK
jgi:hypothetical protein